MYRPMPHRNNDFIIVDKSSLFNCLSNSYNVMFNHIFKFKFEFKISLLLHKKIKSIASIDSQLVHGTDFAGLW